MTAHNSPNVSPALDQGKNGLDANNITEVLEDSRTVLLALEYLPQSECKSMHEAAKKIFIDCLVGKLRMATCKDADALKNFDVAAAKKTVESLPGLDNAIRELEVKMEKRIREGVVPAMSEIMKLQIRNIIPDIVITSPLTFWALSTWVNENVRPDFGTWLMVFFGNIMAVGISRSISDGMYDTKMKAQIGQLPRGFASWVNYDWMKGELWKNTTEILKKIPSDLAQELERTAKKVINMKRLGALAIALSFTAPFAYDGMVTEPAEERYMQAMIHSPEKAIQEMAEKMKAPNATANIVKKLLGKDDDTILTEQKSKGHPVRRVDIETNFLMPGNSGYEEETNITMAEDWKKEFVRIDEIGGWIDRDGEEIILPIREESISSLNLSSGDMEKYFGKEKPEFGVRIRVDNSSIETVAIARSGKNITTIIIRPKNTMIHEGRFVGDVYNALSSSGGIGKLSSVLESLVQEMKRQKEEISKLERIKLSPPAPMHTIKIDKKNKKRKK